MKAAYQIHDGIVRACDEEGALIEVYAAPNGEERQELIQRFGVDSYDLDAALDPDEIARFEIASSGTSLIWKQPKNVSVGEQLRFDIGSAGLFIRPGMMLLVTSADDVHFSEREFRDIQNSNDLLLRLLMHTVHHFQGHLKVIKQITAELGAKISVSMENRYYLQMIALSESLIYYIDAIEANASVIGKLSASAGRLLLNEGQANTLHDIMLDMQQCARQANIYSSVLSGLMDARGAIINNNVNTLLKNLTLINVIFLPLNLIASIGGMSEYSMMTHGFDWRLSYTLLVLGMAGIAWLTWVMITRVFNRRLTRRSVQMRKV